ncbi:MAG: hypothetical protein IT198_05625 [Acidimicrobiia bacterium]|nr:hypothetical protein [Acidimicrobiia bacterium]
MGPPPTAAPPPAMGPPPTAPTLAPPEAMPVPVTHAAVTSAPAVTEWAPIPGQFDPPIYEYRPDIPDPASAEIVMAGLPPVHEVAGTAPPAPEGALFPNWGATTAAATPAPPEAIPGPTPGANDLFAPPLLTLDADPRAHDTMWPAAGSAPDQGEARAHSSKLLIVVLAVVAIAAVLYSVFFLL